jgi:hypothetical protein
VTVKVFVPGCGTLSETIEPYKIIGENPSLEALRRELGNQPWYIEKIAYLESRFRQFNDEGYPLPCAAGDGGFGLFQITPAMPSHMWNWKKNIRAGKEKISRSQELAGIFWNRQVCQFRKWNDNNPADPVAVPEHVTYGSVTFSFEPVGHERSFADAIEIKCFNGAPVHFISWLNVGRFVQSPRWSIAAGRNDYVKRVCEVCVPENHVDLAAHMQGAPRTAE